PNGPTVWFLQARMGRQYGFFRPEWADSMNAGATQSPGGRSPQILIGPEWADSIWFAPNTDCVGGRAG
ncbi:MAG: hypothetical protein KGQ60_07030, partial [Planctomycetes bacterium]|nr:hypothetical protein [Planctomycetota bacterium]